MSSPNDALLINAAMLQDYLVNTDGTPLVAGTVTMMNEASSALQNWYYMSSATGPVFTLLDNPLTLSGAGTIQDPNGNDCIPYYFPWVSDGNGGWTYAPYTVYIANSGGTNLYTRFLFPYPRNPFPSNTGNPTNVQNYIINNRFWRFFTNNPQAESSPAVSTISLNDLTSNAWTYQYASTGTAYYQLIAPSQHDGFSMPDINFIRSAAGGGSTSETCTINAFSATSPATFSNDIVPEYYINHTCQTAATGETFKCYQFPITFHTETLSGQSFIFTIQTKSISGSATLTPGIYSFVGSGVSGSNFQPLSTTISMTTSWQKSTITGTFPTVARDTTTEDDAFYLQIQIPIGVAISFDIALPSIYLLPSTSTPPTNSFQTYDQIDAVIGTPRTGDVRTSINSFYYSGWAPMNDGTIGNASSSATSFASAQTWPLFNLLWNLCKNYSAPGAGTSNPLCQMYTSSGTAVGYGPNLTTPTTAIQDWNSNNQLSLTRSMGKVLMGTVPLATLIVAYTQVVTASQLSSTFTASADTNNKLLLTSSSVGVAFGEQVQFTTTGTLPSGLSLATTYYAVPTSTSTIFNVATTLANAQSGTYITYSSAGTGTQTVTTFALAFTSSTALSLFPGCPVVFSNTGGGLPTGILSSSIYYATPSSTTTFCISTSFTNAIQGNYILYSSAGTGTTTVYLTPDFSSIGEYSHSQLGSEVGVHNHQPASVGQLYRMRIAGSGADYTSGPFDQANVGTTGTNQVSTTPFNVTQPGTFMNIYIKL